MQVAHFFGCRRLSFSTISDTTVNSSLPNCLINDNSNNLSVENFSRDLNGAAQNNVKIEGSNGIRVGDAIYHIYYPHSIKGKIIF